MDGDLLSRRRRSGAVATGTAWAIGPRGTTLANALKVVGQEAATSVYSEGR